VTPLPIADVVDCLRAHHGPADPPPAADPWRLILWETVAYLADDDRRRAAFRMLEKRVGLKPANIAAADDEALLAVTAHGIMPEDRVQRLRKCAEIALTEFDGDLRPVLKLPLARAKKALGKFPSIGEPGAEKILLFTRTLPVLALESNGLRVLVRLGFGPELPNYAAMYKRVRAAVDPDLPADCDWLIAAHQLLRRHGQEVCRRSKPACGECPLADGCRHAVEGAQ
jgi:endonuclease III